MEEILAQHVMEEMLGPWIPLIKAFYIKVFFIYLEMKKCFMKIN
jgi:hypothetical protein